MVTSARTGHNTTAAFENICKMILEAQGHLDTPLNTEANLPEKKPP